LCVCVCERERDVSQLSMRRVRLGGY
jgi:hypothetical protein